MFFTFALKHSVETFFPNWRWYQTTLFSDYRIAGKFGWH